MPVHLHHAASEIGARIVLLQDEPIAPGEQAFVQLVLDQPIAAASGDRFVLRDTTAQRTIGGGQFLDLRAPARKRRTPERMAQIEAHAIADPEAALSALLDRPPHSSSICRPSPATARWRVPRWMSCVQRIGVLQIPVAGGVLGLSPATWMKLKRGLLAALETFHAANPDLPGAGLERLRLQLEPRLPAPGFPAFLQGLASKHEIGLDGAWVRLPGHEVRLTPADEKIWSRMRPLLGGDVRFRPPRVRDMVDGARRLGRRDPTTAEAARPHGRGRRGRA